MMPSCCASCGLGSSTMTVPCSCSSITMQDVRLGQRCSRTWSHPQWNTSSTWAFSQCCHGRTPMEDTSSVCAQVGVSFIVTGKFTQYSIYLTHYSFAHDAQLLTSNCFTGKWKPNDYPFVDNVRAIYLTLEKLIQPEETQVNGIVILADYTGVGMSQASNPGPFLAKKVVSILQVWHQKSNVSNNEYYLIKPLSDDDILMSEGINSASFTLRWLLNESLPQNDSYFWWYSSKKWN